MSVTVDLQAKVLTVSGGFSADVLPVDDLLDRVDGDASCHAAEDRDADVAGARWGCWLPAEQVVK